MSYRSRKRKKSEWLSSPPILLIYRLLSILLALSISRWLLYLFNTQFFHMLTLKESFGLFLNGMRFDLSIIAFLNIPVILYYCFPSLFITKKIPQKVIDIYYVAVNGMAILLNFVDIVYFNIYGKHITLSYLKSMPQSDEVTWGVLGQIFFDHWYLVLIFILFILVLWVVTKQTRIRELGKYDNERAWMIRQIVSLIIIVPLTWIAIRGGFQQKYIRQDTALEFSDAQNAPILLNTPFSLLFSDNTPNEIAPVERDSISIFVHNNLIPNRFLIDSTNAIDSTAKNLVVIIMKGIGQEMIGYYNPGRKNHVTPFLDSLLTQCLTFDGRSNSRRSIEVLPSLLAGIPPLMEQDFVASPYAENDFDSFMKHLQKKGYNTIFLHGGDNGTMGFDKFVKRAGIKNYFGRNEYGDDSDYDHQWGIFDGPFLQYVAQTLSLVPSPFAATIYMLSSRYPYKVPKGFSLPEGSYYWSGFEKTVYYVDCALKDFFKKASQMSWFANTLFVITSDYSNSEHHQPKYNNVWGMYAIPIAFYDPSHIVASRCDEIAQQIDLGPSILSAMHVKDTLYSFGRNLFDTLTEPSFISYFNLTYQYSDGQYLVQSDGRHPFGIYKPKTDSLLADNLIDRLQCPDIFRKLYLFLQEYNERMTSNRLTLSQDLPYEKTADSIHH